MRFRTLAGAILLLLAACSSTAAGVGADADAGIEADAEVSDNGQTDEGTPDVSDVAGDTTHGVDADTAEADAPPPSHDVVFEQRTHPTCRADGPWIADRATLFRTTADLADLDVRTVATTPDKVWIGTPTGLFVRLAGATSFTAVDLPEPGAGVADLDVAEDGALLVAAGTKLVVVDVQGQGSVRSVRQAPGAISRCFACDGNFAIVDGIVHSGQPGDPDGSSLTAIDPQPPAGPVRDGACFPPLGAVYATGTSLVSRDSQEATGWHDWLSGTGASGAASRVEARFGALVAAVGESVFLYPSTVLMPGPGGLPTGDVTSIDLSDNGAILAVGHAHGVTRIDLAPLDPAGPEIEHFLSQRYLPSDSVNAVAFEPGSEPVLWVGTPAGVSRLEKVPIRLEEKAGRMMDQLDASFWRLGGFVSANALFADPWTDGPSMLADDDNDGQWTQEAVGAFCYAWQVTGDERYYQAAKKAIMNMALQIDIPASDFEKAGLGRGFITRSFVRDDEGAIFTSKATQPNWHLVHFTDGHDYYWKDDTSSDELTGHFYGFSIYYDLCAKDDAERAWVAEHLTALVGYILDHGFTLPDLDGQPTTHGDYRPERIAIAVDGLEACVNAGYELIACIDAWGGGAYLDSVEILAGMLAAWHVSGQQRFLDAYESLIGRRYDACATFSPDVQTWSNHALANYCDHELADLAFLTLVRYEPYAERRERWIASMLASYEFEKGERNPLKSLALAAVLADPPGVDEGVRTLVEYPEDLRKHRVDASHRRDYLPGGKDRHGDPQFTEVPPYDEIAVKRWDSNPYAVSDGGNPAERRAPTFWLLPYWGLRYYGAVCP